MKETDWDELERRADGVTDLVGTPIDPGIREVVIGLWAHGITTDYSCEGHLFEEADPVFDPAFRPFVPPTVGIEAPPPDPHPLDVDPEDEVARTPLIREQARRWRVQNYELMARLFTLLERFYEGRTVPFHVRLQLCPTAGTWGPCTVSSTGAEVACTLPRAEQELRLTEYQAELTAFGEFLRATAP